VPAILTELQRIPTSGARAVTAFTVDDMELLAIPQLALDVAGAEAGMNAGDSDTDLILLRRQDGVYRPHASLPAPGGEDAEFFTIGERSFLAVASIRAGSGPYRYTTPSTIFEWVAGSFVAFQSVTTHAAKQWKHWQIGERHFLGLAQGLDLPHIEGPNRNSMVYEWDGTSFSEFQVIRSTWAYNWHALEVDGQHFVGHADHVGPSVLYRWDGQRLIAHQRLLERAGRAFESFVRCGISYLLVAGLEEPPSLMRWLDGEFVTVQSLPGLGARELRVVEHHGRLFVIRINFILGTPRDPEPSLRSQVYEWCDGHLAPLVEFPTSGGTDVNVVSNRRELEFVVSNSLSADIRFLTDTVVYALSTDDDGETP
jgi:hypothetical protein